MCFFYEAEGRKIALQLTVHQIKSLITLSTENFLNSHISSEHSTMKRTWRHHFRVVSALSITAENIHKKL